MIDLAYWADFITLAFVTYCIVMLIGWYVVMRSAYRMEFKAYAALIRWAIKYTVFSYNYIAVINWTLLTILGALMIWHDRHWAVLIVALLCAVVGIICIIGKDKEPAIG